MRLLAVFVDEADRIAVESGTAPSFKRYFMAQVLRRRETDTLTGAAFSDVKSQMTGLDQAALARVTQDLRGHIGSAATKVGTEAGMSDLALEIGVPRQLGVFHETEFSVSTLLVTRVSASSSGLTLERVMAQASSAILLKGKVILFTAYSEVHAGSDYEWLRATSRSWVQDAIAANRQ
jgi:hypothetical protein